MDRMRLALICLSVVGVPLPAMAQHHGGHAFGRYFFSPGYGGFSSSYGVTGVSPVVGGSPFFGSFSGGGHHGHHGHHPRTSSPAIVGPGSVWITGPVIAPLPVMPTVSVVPIPAPQVVPLFDDPLKNLPKVSTTGAKLKSLEHQGRGDEKLRKRQWAQAYMHYRSAIDVAGDRAEARFRQAFTYTAMQHFESAVREFKRGLILDPSQGVKGIGVAELFGPDSESLRTSMINKVIDWVREDSRDADRWFLLGLMLHFEDDPRSRDMLKTAKVLAGGDDANHIALLLNAEHEKPSIPAKPPFLPELPASPVIIEGAPAPAPLAPVDGLPPLSDRPMPIAATAP